MDIQNNNVAIQINAKDRAGKDLRVKNCDVFVMHVFTDNPRNYLTFSKRDICQHRHFDELVVPRHQMEQLQSGVVQYTYHYLPVAHTCKYEPNQAMTYAAPEFGEEGPEEPIVDPMDEDFGGFDENLDEGFSVDPVNEEGCYRPAHRHEQLIHSKAIVTSIYWRNIAHPHPSRPMNAVTLTDIERLHRLIEREKLAREKDFEKLQETFGEGFEDKLNEEIERSKAEDEKINDILLSLTGNLGDLVGNVGDNQSKFETDIKTNSEDLKAEISRATTKETELEQLIQGEISRAKSVEEVIDTKIVMEKERATANESNINDRLVSLTDRFDAYKELSTETLKSEIERAKATETALNDKVQGVVTDLAAEVSRAAQQDIEHTNLVTTEANRAQAVENRLEENLATEIDRAKDAEKHILDEVHDVQDKVANLASATNVYTKAEVDNKVNVVQNEVDTINNWIGNHSDNTDELKEKVANLVSDVDKAKGDILTEVAKCDAQNGKLASDIQTLTDSTYTKAEVDGKVNDINSSLAAIENWKDNHNDNTDELKAKVTTLGTDVDKIKSDLADEVTARTNENLTLNAKVEAIEGKVDAEISRAKATEKSLEDNLADEIARAKAAEAANAGNIADVDANLTLEVARAKAAEKVLSDAIEIINGDSATAGSIKKSLEDGKAYTDAEIAKLSLAKEAELADTLKVYATNADVDKKISDVIGTAPEALDTLGKISNALSQDSDAITAINGVLAGKANADDVYTKVEVDTTVNGVNNAISTLETKVNNADATINGRIDDLVAKVSANETNADAAHTTLSDAIAAEETARKAADKVISDKLDAEVEKLTKKYNELNATVISDIADSTAKDTELEAKINANEAAISSETARAKQVEAELNDKINSINLGATNTNLSAEVDRATAAETTIQANLDAEIIRAQNAEKVVSDNLADEVTRAKDAEKALSDKIDAIDLAGANSAISSLSDKIDAEATRAQAQETVLANAIKVNADNLSDEITRAKDAEKALEDKFATIDLTPLRNDVSTLSTKIDNVQTTLQSNIDAEVVRAKAAEKANADNIDSLLSSVSGVSDTLSTLSANLTQLQADSQAKDSEIESALNTEKTRAENAEKALSDKLDIINGDSSTVGSILHAIHDSEHYTDDEIAKVISALDIHRAEADAKYLTEHQSLADYYNKATINSMLDDYATKVLLNNVANDVNQLDQSLDSLANNVYTKSEVDSAIANVDVTEQLKGYVTKSYVDTSLAGYATKSSVSALETELNNKVDTSAVYTKSEVDSAIANVDVTEQLKDYVPNASINDIIDTAISGSDEISSLSDDLTAEIARAKAAEKEINDSIEAVSGIVAQAVEDLNSIFDTSVGEGGSLSIVTKDELTTLLDDYYTKDAVTQVLVDMATKSEVDDAIAAANTQAQNLVNAAKADVTALIPDVSGKADNRYQAKGNYLTAHQSLDSYYTKSQVNDLVANIIWSGNADEFAALEAAGLDDNKIYIVVE